MSEHKNILQEPALSYESFQEGYYELAGQAISKTYIKSIIQLTRMNVPDFIDLIPISIDTYKRKNIFNPIVTEKVLQIEEVYRKGLDAFGPGFYDWFNSPNTYLGGVKPQKLLSNSFGVRQLIELLGRMEYGILA